MASAQAATASVDSGGDMPASSAVTTFGIADRMCMSGGHKCGSDEANPEIPVEAPGSPGTKRPRPAYLTRL